MNHHEQAKQLIAPWQQALMGFDERLARQALSNLSTDHTRYKLCYPFGVFKDADRFFTASYQKLLAAWPDLERRDTIIMAGEDPQGNEWVGCAGYYTGTFLSPFLDIPPTGQQAHLRFHEFYRIEQNKLAEFQGIWDLPSIMMQAGAWPLAPSLGLEWHVPAPATQDGLRISGDEAQALASRTHVMDMIEAMQKHPRQPPQAMELERFWHPNLNWYGPAGIGTCRGIAGFRHWHQIPFLAAMPDRGQYDTELEIHFFAEGDYVGFTGWPNMKQTLTDGGWLGIAPSGKMITLSSLDFWRLEHGKIKENWVLIDMLDIYHQLGVDVFARLAEFNKARNLNPINFKKDY